MTDISIPAPAFDLYELVMLHWDGEQIPTRIVRRLYDLDEECWLYGVAGRMTCSQGRYLRPGNQPNHGQFIRILRALQTTIGLRC